MTRQVDAIIVGAGQAGPPLAGRLTDAGHTVAAMERKLIGGRCVNTGCIPTKTVMACAHAPALGPARRRVRRRHGTTGHRWVRGLRGVQRRRCTDTAYDENTHLPLPASVFAPESAGVHPLVVASFAAAMAAR